MARYIDAEKLREYVGKNYVFRVFIDEQPTTDVVEVVRCKDCKHRDDDGMCCGRGWPIQLVPGDGFCDKGERRDDGEIH